MPIIIIDDPPPHIRICCETEDAVGGEARDEEYGVGIEMWGEGARMEVWDGGVVWGGVGCKRRPYSFDGMQCMIACGITLLLCLE